MTKIIGKIRINEDRIVTTKNGIIETWTRWGNGDENHFIVYNGDRYKLLKSKETEIIEEVDTEWEIDEESE